MNLSFLNIIRLLFFSFTFWGVFLLGSELFFLVTNSAVNSSLRNEPPQDLSSGLFNSWVNDSTNDYQKMKAKGAILIDLDLSLIDTLFINWSFTLFIIIIFLE